MVKNFVKNVLGVSIYRYGYQAVILLSSIATSRLLTPVEYGTVALITVITGFINAFNDSGISLLVIRSDYGERFYKLLYNLSVLMGFILSGVVVLLAFPIAAFNNNDKLIIPTLVSALVILIQTLSVVPMAVLRKREQFITRAKIDFWAFSSSTIVTIALAYFNFSYWSLIISQLYAALVQLIWSNSIVGVNLWQYSFKKSMLSYKMSKKTLLSLSGGTVFTYWSSNTGNFVIGKFFGEALLGIYNRANSLSSMVVNLIGGVLHSILLPTLKSVEKSKDFLTFVRTISIAVLAVCSVINIVVVLYGAEIITFIWSSTWVSVAEYLPYLLFTSYAVISNILSMNVFYLKKQESLFTRVSAISSVVQIAVFLLAFYFPLKDVLLASTLINLLVLGPVLWVLMPFKVLPEIGKLHITLMIGFFVTSAAVVVGYHYQLGMVLNTLLLIYGVLHIGALIPSALFIINRRKQTTA